jgi:hypothetical protein
MCCRLPSEAFNKVIALKSLLAEKRQRFKFWHLSIVNMRGTDGGGWVSSGIIFLACNVLPTFSEAFSEEIALNYQLAEKRKRFEIPASLHYKYRGTGGGGWVSSGIVLLSDNVMPTFLRGVQ